ncbi:thioredoxin family protein [Thermaurantimonas aggregans]|uniref:Thioredoxin family protein n=1 Tax=Thermaurantimonas aggregans TaxID=2173829 RepID=A0A401XNX5_9FLAO|nr:thioredoxin family protein [Thermaurantimonas aggregans]MCX8149834.1 thioredoxin family protein [Thermaurantimonas aggregans]GCD78717.1 thioredoxin family protein [Thermaurantimonas aggregans]
MKKHILTTAFVLLGGFFGFAQIKEQLAIGDAAPLIDVKMKNVDGKHYDLKSLQGKKGLIVVFSCNTCPFVLGWQDQYNPLYERAREAGLGMVLINSNEAFRKKEDSFEAMREHALKNQYRMPYLVDENHRLADAFGAQTTPHVFVFDQDWKLVFKGSINDKYENSRSGSEPTKFYLMDAIEAIASGTAIKIAESRAIGCSIKRLKN